MGPRPDGRGRDLGGGLSGAWLWLQWGRGRMAAEGVELIVEIDGSWQLQWGRGRMAAEGGQITVNYSGSLDGFNGAAAGWPRKADSLCRWQR